jgi:Flp pilus assembly protein TadD
MAIRTARHIRIDTSALQSKLWHEQGIRALALDRLEDAVRAFRKALEFNPRHEAAWNDLGVVMEALGNPVEAMGCYRQVLKIRPDHAQARSNLGMLWFQVQAAGLLQRQAFGVSAAG